MQTKLFEMESKQKYPLVFFTDITTKISNFCLLNIKSYHNRKKCSKKIIYIDPSVYQLVKTDEYSKVDFMHILLEQNLLRENEWISIDYPCDMNAQYTQLFIEKSYHNNIKYKDNLKYICAIQSEFYNFQDFVKQSERLRSVWEIPGKIIGIGNLCRIMRPDSFTNNVMRYIRNNMSGHKIHFYGMALKVLKGSHFKSLLYNDFQISVDSTKWTKAVSSTLKNKYNINTNSKNRNEFFLEYMKNLEKNGIWVEY